MVSCYTDCFANYFTEALEMKIICMYVYMYVYIKCSPAKFRRVSESSRPWLFADIFLEPN